MARSNESTSTPRIASRSCARGYPSRLPSQRREQLELGPREIDWFLSAHRLHALLVERQVAGPDDGASLRRHIDPTKHRAHTRDELFGAERLRHVVVRPELE